MDEIYRHPLYRGCITTLENFIILYNELSKTFAIESCNEIYIGPNSQTTMVIKGGIKLEKFKSKRINIVCYFTIVREGDLSRSIINHTKRKKIVENIIDKIRSEKKLTPFVKYL